MKANSQYRRSGQPISFTRSIFSNPDIVKKIPNMANKYPQNIPNKARPR